MIRLPGDAIVVTLCGAVTVVQNDCTVFEEASTYRGGISVVAGIPHHFSASILDRSVRSMVTVGSVIVSLVVSLAGGISPVVSGEEIPYGN